MANMELDELLERVYGVNIIDSAPVLKACGLLRVLHCPGVPHLEDKV